MRENLAKNDNVVEGFMTVKENKNHFGEKQSHIVDPLKTYINNFEECATVFS